MGADLAGADLAGAYLAGADLAGANLARANLVGAYLAGAYLADADLADADLAGADLAGADLARADLARAYLVGAYLAGADLGEGRVYVDGGSDRRGYRFFTIKDADSLTIRAGCRRWSSFNDARAHYQNSYRSDGDVAECVARLALMEQQIEARTDIKSEAA